MLKIHACTCTHTDAHVHTHARTHTHAHTHTQIFVLYWSIHPILSSLFTTALCIGLLLCVFRTVVRTKLTTIKKSLEIL